MKWLFAAILPDVRLSDIVRLPHTFLIENDSLLLHDLETAGPRSLVGDTQNDLQRAIALKVLAGHASGRLRPRS